MKETNYIGRCAYLDWIAGLLIVVVILLHIELFTDYQLHFWHVWGERVFYFFMSWFFFKSGMFDKEQDYATVCKKVWHTLVIPYLFFSIISWLIWLPQFFHSQNSILLLFRITFSRWVAVNLIPGNNPLWFLIALIGCRLLYPWFRKLLKNNYVVAFSAFLAAYVYHLIYMYATHKYLMLGIAQSCIGISYYAIGVELRHIQYLKSVFGVSLAVYIVTVVSFCPVINFAYAGTVSGELSWVCSLPVCVAGIITWNNLIRFIPTRFLNLSGLCHIGNNSMTYYGIHWSIIITIVFMYNVLGLQLFDLPSQYVMLLSCAVILPVADVLERRCRPLPGRANGHVLKGHAGGAAAEPLP